MPTPDRPDPDQLLATLKREQTRRRQGTLKVFLGMCAGVGKTYAMLEAAQRARKEGRGVVIGYVETHGRRETDALTDGLEIIPRKPVVYRDVTLTEMDLDAVLARKPQLALVDELAHTNAPGSRHPKRHQDVAELLEAGIDVFTTLNVQHIESRADTIREITGATIRETVPDTVLTVAEIELVDLSPEDLLQRLSEGKVYIPERAEAAARNFLREGNLIALREMALRLAAERVGQDVRDYMQSRRIAGPWKTGHRLMVAVSASPYSEQMIRWTRRMAVSLGGTWIAAHIETSRSLSGDEQDRLTRNLSLARTLGAEIRSTTDEDVAKGILTLARAQNVTQIIVGKPAGLGPLRFVRSFLLLNRLVRESGGIDVHIMRVDSSPASSPTPLLRFPFEAGWSQYGQSALFIAILTALNFIIASFIGHRSIGLIYLMGIVALALRLDRGPVYLGAAASALAWDYLFLPPPFTLHIGNIEDVMMFAMYFVVAMAMGHLISRIRAKESMDHRREERATAMYLLTLDLADASSWPAIETAVAENIKRTFRAEATLFLADAQGRLKGDLSERERGPALWAYQHRQPAGRFTDTLPLTEALFLPLYTGDHTLGVLRLQWQQASPPTLEQRTMLDGFQRHISLVVDRQLLQETKAQHHLLAESERLSQVLLNAVSHELRTPIAAIQAAVGGYAPGLPADVRQTLIGEIRQASDRLSRLVGNLLDMARVESGHVKPRMDWCDVRDIINAALKAAGPDLANRSVTVHVPSGFPLVRADSRLIEQALVNLLMNAAMYTPPGSPVEVSADAGDDAVGISVSDRGPGLDPAVVPRLFDKFYRAPGASAGGTGLGLSIVKGFIDAHGGQVHAGNRPAGGAVFTLKLPRQEPPSP